MSDQLNTEEREILEEFERGELKSVPGADREMEIAPQAARNTFAKTRRVNLRVTERDFQPSTRAGPRGGHSVPDAAVERDPQIPGRPADREEIEGNGDGCGCRGERHRLRWAFRLASP